MTAFILLALLLLWGWSASLLVMKKVDCYLRLASAFAFGALGLTLQLFVSVFIFNLPLDRFFLFLIIFESLLFLFLAAKRGLIKIARPALKLDVVNLVIAVLIVWQLFVVAAGASIMPVATYDSLAVWSWRSKVLADNFDGFFDPDSSFYWKDQGHSNYPPHLPLLAYWLNFGQEGWNENSDVIINIIPAAYFIATSVLMFGAVRREAGTRIALILTFILSSMPLLAYHGWNNYADFPLAFWALLAAVGLKRVLEGDAGWSPIPVIAVCGALFTKNEGIFWLVSMLTVLSAYSWKTGKMKGFMRQAIIVLALSGPWLLFMISNRLDFQNTESGFTLHLEIFMQMYNRLFVDFSWNIWWFVFPVLALLYFRKLKNIQLLGVFIYFCLGFAQVIAVFLLTPAYRYLLNGTAFSRIMISATVVSIYVAALLLSEKYEKNIDNSAYIQ